MYICMHVCIDWQCGNTLWSMVFKHLEVYGGGISLLLGRGVYGAQDLLRPSVLCSGCVRGDLQSCAQGV